ncbi:amidase [Microbacterium sp. NPDC079995]|uniref:amidase n=1 Tax=unclassified Microbacterium TaxID=2609290 RepID=UPI003450BDF4
MTVSLASRFPTWSALEIAAAVAAGEVSATDVLTETRRRVEADTVTNAWVCFAWDAAAEHAADIDRRVAAGLRVGALAGVPFGVKDTQDLAGLPTRWGSLLKADAVPAASDDPYISRLRAADAVAIGKTTTPEFASGLLCESRATGTTRNPWNPELTPGGSSGGSAAAVAAGHVPFATGSDGGGSIRIPAGITGLVGHKTTFGLVPELDRAVSETSTVGVLTWDVADTVAILDVMAGPLRGDAHSAAVAAPPVVSRIDDVDLNGLRIAYVPELDRAGATDEVRAACRDAVDALRAQFGLRDVEGVVELDAGANEVFVAAGSVDPWSLNDFGDLEQTMPLFSDYFATRLERTGAVTIQQLGLALQHRRRLRRKIHAWFDEVDLIIMPTLSTADIPAEGPPPEVVPGQEYQGVAAVAPLTRIANLGGVPATSVPVGVGAGGGPIGLQILAGPGRDDLALAAARAIEAQGRVPVASRPYNR